MASVAKGGLPPRVLVLGGALGLIALTIAAGQYKVAEGLAALLVGYGLAALLVGILAHWTWLVYGLAAANLLIPEDNRYTLYGSNHAGFQLAPYRIFVMVMLIGWLLALFVDPRVRARKTQFDGPILLIVIATFGSIVFNPTRVFETNSFVIKSLILFVSLTAFIYVVASVVRTRETIDRIFKILVLSGVVVAVGAIIERHMNYNIFNHLHRFLPMMTFNSGAELTNLLRNGAFRAIASAGHPIELSNDMAMLTPIAAYLGIRGSKWWWSAVLVLLLGNLSTGSRTGIIGLLVVLLVFICMRPRETLRCWPALIPLLVTVQLVMPHAISGTISSFFPKGGLIAQQSQTFAAHGQIQQASRLSRIGPQLRETFAKHNEFFGFGNGTAIVGRTCLNCGPTAGSEQDNAQILDDQWLGILLNTGLVGFAAWLWFFTRVIRRLSGRAKLERGTQEGWLPVTLAASIACYAIAMYFYDALGFMQATVTMYLLVGLAASVLWMDPVRASRRSGGANRRPTPNGRPSGTSRLIMPELAGTATGRAG
jgi:polysaccharide biosynthesis protein PslJ